MISNAIVWGLLGLYLDQILGSQYGVSKPWNFCCKCKKKAIRADGMSERFIDSEALNLDPRQFERVTDVMRK